jgi:hypothetical protein
MIKLNLEALNSATKYPSIPTFHKLGEKGRPTDEMQVEFSDDIITTEKVDGTNARVVLLPSDFERAYLIGSREELLTADGDLVANPSMGIVEATRRLAETRDGPASGLVVFFSEVYGGKVTANSKQYTGGQAVSARLFDVALIPREVLDQPKEEIARWRDGGGQLFCREDVLAGWADARKIDLVPRVRAEPPPADPTKVFDWLMSIAPKTLCAIDDGAGGAAEGVVIRSIDRSRIAKLRFDDYRKVRRR